MIATDWEGRRADMVTTNQQFVAVANESGFAAAP
jgi:hypothetical protein